jgi:hypothetical protein
VMLRLVHAARRVRPESGQCNSQTQRSSTTRTFDSVQHADDPLVYQGDEAIAVDGVEV